MYLTVLSFETRFFVKNTATENAPHKFTFHAFPGCTEDASLGSIERTV